MSITVTGRHRYARIEPPVSKSETIRAVFCAMLADKPTDIIIKSTPASDISAAADAAAALGAACFLRNGILKILPITLIKDDPHFYCRGSAAVARFIIPIAAVLCRSAYFDGETALRQRPFAPIIESLKNHGLMFSADALPFGFKGTLTGGSFTADCSISSQFLSGLMMALPILDEATAIHVTGTPTSRGYADMTARVSAAFGVTLPGFDTTYGGPVTPGQKYVSPGIYRPDEDWSAASVFMAMGAVKNGVSIAVGSADRSGAQPDRFIITLLRQMGADITEDKAVTEVRPAEKLKAVHADMRECPDLLPALAVAAAFACGTSRFDNIGRLRYKECDRVNALEKLLGAFGINSYDDGSSLFVTGGTPRSLHCADTFDDHRIAMAACALGLLSGGAAEISAVKCVNKSYPGFFADFAACGGHIDGIGL